MWRKNETRAPRRRAERRVTTICRIEPQYAIVDMISSGGWPEDTYKWLRIISNGIDHDALLFEAEELIPLQAR